MPDDKKELFLAKAREADEEARKATNPKLKETWTRLAKSYRELAEESFRRP